MGRKLVRDNLKNKSISYVRAERFLLGYASSIGGSNLFVKGKIRFSISHNKIILNYVVANNTEFSSEIKYSSNNRNDIDDMMFLTQDFVLNTFVNFERNGSPMKYKDIGVILGIKPQSVETIVKGILDKIKGLGILVE